ncbi:hypothetical protein LUZ63_015205 [Rhynchospora breviuscula]|uniref:Uncharacterized protein n=1 Tax=Rhynchospora breviuscula TaxID=2022672 RepID=A0A9Q0HMJ4_9POAL|nr:hypothetical protein LUZ63_015205 [Rhynchospora breviuscula]
MTHRTSASASASPCTSASFRNPRSALLSTVAMDDQPLNKTLNRSPDPSRNQHLRHREAAPASIANPNPTNPSSGIVVEIEEVPRVTGLQVNGSDLEEEEKSEYTLRGALVGIDPDFRLPIQISAFLAGLFHSGLIERALIVAPKTLTAHWIKQLSFVDLKKKTRDFSGTSVNRRNNELLCTLKKGGIRITTYAIVRNNYKLIRGDNLNEEEHELRWDYVILDEGHIIKNLKTQSAQSLYEIPSRHRIIITGTPIQNNLKEFWALFNFCCPKVLGEKNEFEDRYEEKIMRGIEKKASQKEIRFGSSVAEDFREKIKPYFLRRLKSEVFSKENEEMKDELPMKTELVVWLKLTACQDALLSVGYKLLRMDGNTKFAEREKIVKEFQEDNGPAIFLLTTQVGGLGLTLTRADRVIVVDPFWNPSVDNQCVERPHRIGQTKEVIVYRLMTCGTIEEIIYKRQVFKGDLFKTATGQEEPTRSFSGTELEEIFRLPEEGFDVSVAQRQLQQEHAGQVVMDEYLTCHIKDLENQGIAGVSHHSPLFSKTAIVPVVPETNESDRTASAQKPRGMIQNASSSSQTYQVEIRAKIDRFRNLLANKDMVAKLHDKGDKLRKALAEAELELKQRTRHSGTGTGNSSRSFPPRPPSNGVVIRERRVIQNPTPQKNQKLDKEKGKSVDSENEKLRARNKAEAAQLKRLRHLHARGMEVGQASSEAAVEAEVSEIKPPTFNSPKEIKRRCSLYFLLTGRKRREKKKKKKNDAKRST